MQVPERRHQQVLVDGAHRRGGVPRDQGARLPRPGQLPGRLSGRQGAHASRCLRCSLTAATGTGCCMSPALARVGIIRQSDSQAAATCSLPSHDAAERVHARRWTSLQGRVRAGQEVMGVVLGLALALQPASALCEPLVLHVGHTMPTEQLSLGRRPCWTA